MASLAIENLTVHLQTGDVVNKIFNRATPVPGSEDEEGQVVRSVGGNVVALDGVDLSVADGETLAVIGPSGCGKTTLLRAVGGLVSPVNGRIFFGDDDVTEWPPRDRRVGIVFQNYALYPHMESKRNLAFFFKMHQREEEVPERVEATCAVMGEGFDQLLGRKPKSLSGGEKQRVAIARCIIRDPTVFLFDEPLSNLDAKLRAQTRVQVKRLLRRFGITALYVTHDQVEAVALGDRIAVMQAGKIVQIGTYEEIYERPLSRFVAGFFGHPPMNLLGGAVEHGRVLVNGHAFAVEGGPLRILEGEKVTLGIRPEHVSLDRRPSEGTLELKAEVIQPLVSERKQLVHFDLGLGQVVAKVDAGLDAHVGEMLHVRLPAERLRVFDSRDICVV